MGWLADPGRTAADGSRSAGYLDPSTKHSSAAILSLCSRRGGRRRASASRGTLPNDLWQIDATRVALAAREQAWMLDVVDDHGRYLLAAVAWASRSWLSRARACACARVLAMLISPRTLGRPRGALSRLRCGLRAAPTAKVKSQDVV
jgi:hypothetical protein